MEELDMDKQATLATDLQACCPHAPRLSAKRTRAAESAAGPARLVFTGCLKEGGANRYCAGRLPKLLPKAIDIRVDFHGELGRETLDAAESRTI